jgi:hypothetical protein
MRGAAARGFSDREHGLHHPLELELDVFGQNHFAQALP